MLRDRRAGQWCLWALAPGLLVNGGLMWASEPLARAETGARSPVKKRRVLFNCDGLGAYLDSKGDVQDGQTQRVASHDPADAGPGASRAQSSENHLCRVDGVQCDGAGDPRRLSKDGRINEVNDGTDGHSERDGSDRGVCLQSRSGNG